jgi:hypothetical protein
MEANRHYWYRDRLEQMRAEALAAARQRRAVEAARDERARRSSREAYREARGREWDERPLDALGQRLVDQLVPYLEFFAIARGT